MVMLLETLKGKGEAVMFRFISTCVLVFAGIVLVNGQVQSINASKCPQRYFREVENITTYVVFHQVVFSPTPQKFQVFVNDLTVDPFNIKLGLDYNSGTSSTTISVLIDGRCDKVPAVNSHNEWQIPDEVVVWVKKSEDWAKWEQWLTAAQKKRQAQLDEWHSQSRKPRKNLMPRTLPPKS